MTDQTNTTVTVFRAELVGNLVVIKTQQYEYQEEYYILSSPPGAHNYNFLYSIKVRRVTDGKAYIVNPDFEFRPVSFALTEGAAIKGLLEAYEGHMDCLRQDTEATMQCIKAIKEARE